MGKVRIADDAEKVQRKLLDSKGKVAGRKQADANADIAADTVRNAYAPAEDATGDMRDAGRRR